jgi:SAM-dependent methyltransferase
MDVPLRRRDAWLRLALNARLLDAERQLLSSVLEQFFGYYLLAVGGWGRHAHQPNVCRIRHQLLVDGPGAGANIAAAPGALPVASNSVDVVVLPHTLELTTEPHGVLREANRVLVGEGRIVILGFNPWSPWRLRVPWGGRMVSRNRLTDWLALLDLEVERVEEHSWSIPFGSTRVDAWFSQRADDGWPLPAGAYLVVARKHVSAMTLVGPVVKARKPSFEPVGADR